eukprot:TRINITY_DN45958_c0_g1_i1.p1 TRINITY_DN45958_c0_g1~~TRINITY_DN45958_c0_g1_i1.p1  ORF type:complete len:191 (+),score=17.47 TRINITY_DN45958_c0_g1_i1:45-575(+)
MAVLPVLIEVVEVLAPPLVRYFGSTGKWMGRFMGRLNESEVGMDFGACECGKCQGLPQLMSALQDGDVDMEDEEIAAQLDLVRELLTSEPDVLPSSLTCPDCQALLAEWSEEQTCAALEEAIESYCIQDGDTLSELAEAWGVTVDDILEMNPQIEDPDQIFAGDELYIPAGANVYE